MMDFRRGRKREDPEINLIPFIDVLLVVLIFLMVTTTYSKFTELQITLPTADAERRSTGRSRSTSPSMPRATTRSTTWRCRSTASPAWLTT